MLPATDSTVIIVQVIETLLLESVAVVVDAGAAWLHSLTRVYASWTESWPGPGTESSGLLIPAVARRWGAGLWTREPWKTLWRWSWPRRLESRMKFLTWRWSWLKVWMTFLTRNFPWLEMMRSVCAWFVNLLIDGVETVRGWFLSEVWTISVIVRCWSVGAAAPLIDMIVWRQSSW